MYYENLDFKSEDGIGWILFSRPEKLNAINTDVLIDFEKAVSHCEKDEKIKVIVVTGNDRAFAAGADVEKLIDADIKRAYETTDTVVRVHRHLAETPKPTIASVAGFALGGGCEIALCCDFS